MNKIATRPQVGLSILNSFTTDDGRPLVVLNSGGEPVTTSKLIADFFGRRHDEVVASVDKWKTLVKPAEQVQFFSHLLIKIPGGQGATQEIDGYELTEEGFALVALSFTGEKAAMFKIAYVKAFRLMKQEIVRLQLENTRLLEQKLLKEGNKNANVKDRIQYLEGKKAMLIDDKMNKFAQECAQLDREQRHGVEQELFDLRCRLEGDDPPKKSDYNARIKFVKTRCKNALARVTILEHLFKGTEMEGEHTVCYAIDGIRAELEFSKHW